MSRLKGVWSLKENDRKPMPAKGRELKGDEKKSSWSKMLPPPLPFLNEGSKKDAKGFELPKKRANVSRGSWNS